MPFVSPLVAADLGDGRWELVRHLIYQGARDEFIVPIGFQTDFASVPRILQSIAPRLGRQNRAAVLHDWLYAELQFVLKDGGFVTMTRKEADGVFRRTMREDGVSWLRRATFYWAVRLGGWLPWRRHRAR